MQFTIGPDLRHPILLFARRWFEKYGKLPTEEDFIDKLQNFRTERDRAYKIVCDLNSEELKKLRRDASVRKFLASLGRKQ